MPLPHCKIHWLTSEIIYLMYLVCMVSPQYKTLILLDLFQLFYECGSGAPEPPLPLLCCSLVLKKNTNNLIK